MWLQYIRKNHQQEAPKLPPVDSSLTNVSDQKGAYLTKHFYMSNSKNISLKTWRVRSGLPETFWASKPFRSLHFCHSFVWVGTTSSKKRLATLPTCRKKNISKKVWFVHMMLRLGPWVLGPRQPWWNQLWTLGMIHKPRNAQAQIRRDSLDHIVRETNVANHGGWVQRGLNPGNGQT